MNVNLNVNLNVLTAPPTSPPALAAQDLHLSLGAKSVLSGVNLAIPAGQWTCVVGPNGAGKSTLLKALSGLLPAHAVRGKVLLQGHLLDEIPPKHRAQQLAWLGQNPSCADDAVAYDVAMLGRLPHQHWLAAPSAADHVVCEQAMRQAQCWDWRQRRLGTLSGGERQRVFLARLLAVQAQVLLMDEPLAHLDAPQQADWLATVRALVAQGCTVVSVLHELTVALQADYLLIVAEGAVCHLGRTQDRETHQALTAAFKHRIALHALAGQWVALPQ